MWWKLWEWHEELEGYRQHRKTRLGAECMRGPCTKFFRAIYGRRFDLELTPKFSTFQDQDKVVSSNLISFGHETIERRKDE
jgi:hypothetical protein